MSGGRVNPRWRLDNYSSPGEWAGLDQNSGGSEEVVIPARERGRGKGGGGMSRGACLLVGGKCVIHA